MNETGTKNKELIREAFKQVFGSATFSEDVIAQYFTSNYQQWVDGRCLNFKDFVQHIKAQKARVEAVSIEFKSLIAEGNRVASVHLIDAVTVTGNPVKGRVMAVFTIENDKIAHCEELTFIEEAEDGDRDLGHVK